MRKVGDPVVLEIISADILHKTDVGRALGLYSIEAVEASYLQIMENA